MIEHSIDEIFLEGSMEKFKETKLEVKIDKKKIPNVYNFWIEYPWEAIKKYYNLLKVA